MKEHCIAKMNTSHNIILGGNIAATKTYIVNSKVGVNWEWHDGPDLPGDGRFQHACAHIKHKNGSNYVIAVGGHLNDDPNHPMALRTTDILDVEKLVWLTGKGYIISHRDGLG